MVRLVKAVSGSMTLLLAGMAAVQWLSGGVRCRVYCTLHVPGDVHQFVIVAIVRNNAEDSERGALWSVRAGQRT